MSANIFWKPDSKLINDFMTKYVESFNHNLGYSNWHYINGFTKNCIYKSEEYYKDVVLMKQLHDSIMQFQRKYYPDIVINDFTLHRKRLSQKQTIFLYWHQGKNNLPPLQQLCYNRLCQKCSKNFNIVLLDNSNIQQYITIPDVIKNAMLEKRMWLQHYVDYIRIALLAKYEAIWFDATIFVRDDLSTVNFSYPFWSIKCKNMYANTWAENVIPEMNQCQIYAMGGYSNYFYIRMKELIEYHFETFGIAYSYYMMYYIANFLYQTDYSIHRQFDELQYNNETVECFANKRQLDDASILQLWQSTTDTHLFKLLKYKDDNTSDNAYRTYLLMKGIYEHDKLQTN